MIKTLQSQEESPLDRHLGQRIALRRQKLNMSTADLEKAISMSTGSVARFEAARQSLNATQLFTLSRALDVPTAEYIAEAERFLDAYFKIDDVKVRSDILGLMRAAAGDEAESD